MPPRANSLAKDERLDHVYSIMQSAENRLGGGEGIEGIYGSITRTGMQRIFDSMRHNCGLDHNSVLVDVGAGLGRPLLHALVNPGIKSAYGIELDHVKVAKAEAFVEQTLTEMAKRGHVAADLCRPAIQCTSIEQVPSFGSATHAYSFWEGIPVQGREAFGRLFAASKTIKSVAVVQRAIRNPHPTVLMQSYGFGPLMLISNFSVSMSGSGAGFQAYVFSKIPSATAAFMDAVLTGSARTPAPAKQLLPSKQQQQQEEQAAAKQGSRKQTGTGVAAAAVTVVPALEVDHADADKQQVKPPLTVLQPNLPVGPSAGSVSPRGLKQANIQRFGRQTKNSLALKAGSQKAIGKDSVKGKLEPAVVVSKSVVDLTSEELPAVRRSSRLRSLTSA